MGEWSDKVALVTGASTGLGLVLAKEFARNGIHVALAARNAERLAQAAEQVRGVGGGGVFTCSADVTSQEDVERMVAQVVERFGRLDLLVNNAGKSTRGKVLATSPEDFQALWEVNFLACVRCTRAAMPHLVATRGHLVNIGSLAAKSASAFLGAYPATKFPLAAYSQQLRLEMSEPSVHVLLVCTGPLSREDAGTRYDQQSLELPEHARRPGGGVRLRGISPQRLAVAILEACRKRQPEIVWPAKARLLFALSQLSPAWGDWLLARMTRRD